MPAEDRPPRERTRPRRAHDPPNPLGDPPAELEEFLRLYGAGRFFDAHEVLEAAWRRSDEPRMRFLQGLIQWAVAFEHHRRGNAHGARVLLARSWSRLRDAPEDPMGLDLSACRASHPALERAFTEWEAGGRRPAVSAPPIRRRGARVRRDVG